MPVQKFLGIFHPRSPYACAKVFGHFITQNYRESYGMFACSLLAYNHESEFRPTQFVTRKITDAVSKIKLNKQKYLELGNLDSKRDWGVVDMPITWEGSGLGEVGKYNNKTIVKINPKYYRPAEVEFLLGDYSQAKKELGWKPKTTFKKLVKLMVGNDLKLVGGKK